MTEEQKIETTEDENTEDVEGHGPRFGAQGSARPLDKAAETDDIDDVEGHAPRL